MKTQIKFQFNNGWFLVLTKIFSGSIQTSPTVRTTKVKTDNEGGEREIGRVSEMNRVVVCIGDL